jgi:NADH dehydrogenase
MRVILAGGTGFLGRHVAEALAAAGHTALLLTRGTRIARAADGAGRLRSDVGSDAPPPGAMRGRDAPVNPIGIKSERGTRTFERVHVEATRRLIATARELSIRRYIHISVVCRRPDARGASHDTNWRAEGLIRAAGLDDTILKPGVIYGPGDDLETRLVEMIRFAPVFPVVGRGDSLLQPVHAGDAAAAVVGESRTTGRSAGVTTSSGPRG